MHPARSVPYRCCEGGDDVPDDYAPRTVPYTPGACVAHRFHSPRPTYLEVHHVLPLGWGGPDTRENEVTVCSTGHASIHRLLNLYRMSGGKPPWILRRQWGHGERKVAERGWQAYVATR